MPNASDAPAEDFGSDHVGPAERTYSEGCHRAYHTPRGAYAPQFGGNRPYVAGAPAGGRYTAGMSDPVVLAVAAASVAIIVFAIVAHRYGQRGESRYFQQRRQELAARREQEERMRRERTALAAQILATSSTSDVPGYIIVRQIEAVFTDDHPSPALAVEALKALAASRGANAVIHLRTERALNSRCLARGDAVVLRPLTDADGQTGQPQRSAGGAASAPGGPRSGPSARGPEGAREQVR